MKYISHSADDSKKIGKDFSSNLLPGDVALFSGNLGAGKTTFIQGLAEGLGIKDRILSPTFVLQRSHNVDLRGIKKLHHIDLYRLEDATEIDSIGIEETVNDPDSVVLIEWSEKLKNFTPKKGYKVAIEYINDNSREIKIDKF